MKGRVLEKIVEIEERRFIIRKYNCFTGFKVSLIMTSKILPAIQSILPVIAGAIKAGNGSEITQEDYGNMLLSTLQDSFSLTEISKALDMITSDDLDFVMRSALMNSYEDLGANRAPVLRSDGTYGVEGIEYDMLMALRLVCESIAFNIGDFFIENRSASIMSPMFSSFRQSP